MTQDELDALPEEKNGPIYQGPEDCFLIHDRQGRAWMTGWVGNTQVKKRVFV